MPRGDLSVASGFLSNPGGAPELPTAPCPGFGEHSADATTQHNAVRPRILLGNRFSLRAGTGGWSAVCNLDGIGSQGQLESVERPPKMDQDRRVVRNRSAGGGAFSACRGGGCYGGCYGGTRLSRPSGRMWCFGYAIELAPVPFERTQVVVLTPRYVVQNETDTPIWVQQEGASTAEILKISDRGRPTHTIQTA